MKQSPSEKYIINEIRKKISLCSDKTKEDRARKGAYVDCLLIIQTKGL